MIHRDYKYVAILFSYLQSSWDELLRRKQEEIQTESKGIQTVPCSRFPERGCPQPSPQSLGRGTQSGLQSTSPPRAVPELLLEKRTGQQHPALLCAAAGGPRVMIMFWWVLVALPFSVLARNAGIKGVFSWWSSTTFLSEYQRFCLHTDIIHYSLTHSLIHPPTHSPIHPPAHPFIHPPSTVY